MPRDQNTFGKSTTNRDAVIGLASPKDRLAAYILDCVLLLPLVQLLQSPIKKWIFETHLFENGIGVSTYRYFNLAIFIVLFVVYYIISIWWGGQSLGKRFFSIKVISYKGKLTFIDSFTRSIATFFEILSLGFPFLAIFSHPMRRPLHDRVADTIVISQKNPTGFPRKTEIWKAKFVGATYIFLISIGFVVYSLSPGGERSLVQTANEECQMLTKGFENDLERIFELNLVSKIDADCLYNLTRENIWQEKESALSHFLMASATKDNKELSNEYLGSVCKQNKNHHLCDISQSIQSGGFFNLKGLQALDQIIQNKKVYSFARIVIAASYSQLGRYSEVEGVLSPIRNTGILRPLIASLQFHSLLGQLKWDEAKWIYKTHDEINDNDILYFMQNQMASGQLSDKQKIQLLDYFYPNLVNRKSMRQPASLPTIPDEILDIYSTLEGRL